MRESGGVSHLPRSSVECGMSGCVGHGSGCWQDCMGLEWGWRCGCNCLLYQCTSRLTGSCVEGSAQGSVSNRHVAMYTLLHNLHEIPP